MSERSKDLAVSGFWLLFFSGVLWLNLWCLKDAIRTIEKSPALKVMAEMTEEIRKVQEKCK